MKRERNGPTIVSVGGGKGGVGKSLFAVNAACALAKKGTKVVLADADLGGANVHTFFGITLPGKTLKHFIRREVDSLAEVLIPSGLKNLSLLCGASALLSIANPNFAQKARLIREISRLDADIVVVDVGAGATLNNLDFFNASRCGVIVTAPTPTAIQNAYGFLKLSLHRKIIRRLGKDLASKLFPDSSSSSVREMEPKKLISAIEKVNREKFEEIFEEISSSSYLVVVNMASEKEGEKVFKALETVSAQFLGLKLRYLGNIPFTRKIEESVRKMRPFILNGNAAGVQEIERAACKILELSKNGRAKRVEPPQTLEEFIENLPPQEKKTAHLVLNDDVNHKGIRLHVQTEDLGPDRKEVVTVVFRSGEVLFSKTTTYDELSGEDLDPTKIQEKVLWQHRAVISGILKGRLDEKIMT